MTLAWFQCTAGASGDMLLGALVDAGAPLEVVQEAVDALGVEPVRLTRSPVTRHGIAATRIEVHAPTADSPRPWPVVRSLLESARLSAAVRERALDVFARLARAEARVHGVAAEEVHFHEVGALDALADVVGTAAALDWLGVTEAVAGPVSLGSGLTTGAHGVLPVPAPAVLALLAEAGAVVRGGDTPYELCTPTGAALLAGTVRRWGELPPMRVLGSGFGAGARDPLEVPNLLRVVLGEPTPGPVPGEEGPAAGTAVLLATNVDDLDPRLWPAVLARLLEAGASDAWLTPIVMKKGRPAHTLSVLAPEAALPALRRVVFTETSAIGLRESPVAKRALERETRTVTVEGRAVRVKLARLAGGVVNASPEYDDVAAVAAAAGRPVKAVLAAAVAAAEQVREQR